MPDLKPDDQHDRVWHPFDDLKPNPICSYRTSPPRVAFRIRSPVPNSAFSISRALRTAGQGLPAAAGTLPGFLPQGHGDGSLRGQQRDISPLRSVLTGQHSVVNYRYTSGDFLYQHLAKDYKTLYRSDTGRFLFPGHESAGADIWVEGSIKCRFFTSNLFVVADRLGYWTVLKSGYWPFAVSFWPGTLIGQKPKANS